MCFCIMFGKVWKCSAVLLHCVLKGFDVFGCASALFFNVLKRSDVLLQYAFKCFDVF